MSIYESSSLLTDSANVVMEDFVTQLYSPSTSMVSAQSGESVETAHQLKSRTYAFNASVDGVSSSGRKPHCLLACSGSVATVKIPELAVRLSQYFEVLIVCTQNAMFFLMRSEAYNPSMWQKFLAIGGMDLVLEDKDEWDMWNKIGHDILHIDLRRWADVLVVAPASANLIAKASVGVCDNLLLSLLRAWEIRKRPCLLCPAMNTVMWEHPSTQPALRTLQTWGWKLVGPVEKMLACKEVGSGALAHVEDIVHATRRAVEPLHNIAPYLADEEASPLADRNQLQSSKLEMTNNIIPHQIWKEKVEQRPLSDEIHSAELQRSHPLEQKNVAAERKEMETRLNTLQFRSRLVLLPALLLIIGTLQQLKEAKK